MFVGDNILDFPNLSQAAVKNGRRDTRSRSGPEIFMLPNPMYGSWQ